MTSISKKKFGQFKGSEVTLATLSGDNTSISIMNWGATIQNWTVNHSTQSQNSVVLGFDNFDFYPKFSPYFGSIVGRVINRINKGKFELNGINYQLDINRSPNHLHGGITGFGKTIWNFETDEKENSITFSVKSKDGDGGYPGNVNVRAKYKLAGKKLTIEISGTVDRETPLNMGQHNYFNLCSQSEENYNICNHLLYLNASSFTETDQNLIPTGKILSTEGTKMHFYKKKKIGNISLDDNFILNTGNTIDNLAAELINPYNDLSLKLWTDQPGIQVYNASNLDLEPKGLNDKYYHNFSGICLEAQKFPDSVNHINFPSIIASPEKPYFHKTEIEIS